MGTASALGLLLRPGKRLFLLRGQYRARAVQLVAQSRRAQHACAARLASGSLSQHFGGQARTCDNHACAARHATGLRHPSSVAADSSKRWCSNTPASPRLTVRSSRPRFTAANFSGMFVLYCRRAAGRLNSGVRRQSQHSRRLTDHI